MRARKGLPVGVIGFIGVCFVRTAINNHTYKQWQGANATGPAKTTERLIEIAQQCVRGPGSGSTAVSLQQAS